MNRRSVMMVWGLLCVLTLSFGCASEPKSEPTPPEPTEQKDPEPEVKDEVKEESTPGEDEPTAPETTPPSPEPEPEPDPTPPAPEPVQPDPPAEEIHTRTELEGELYELSLVFHVLSPNLNDVAHQSLNPDFLSRTIDEVNLLFNGAYEGAKANIRFKLADDAPQGRQVDLLGIVRHTKVGATTDYNKVLFDRVGGTYWSMRWPLQRYINVYVMDFSQAGTDGVALYPYVPTEHHLDGLSTYWNSQTEEGVNPAVCLSMQAFRGRSAMAIAKVLAHELGHYLGVYHPFIESHAYDDFCSDTPNYDRSVYLSDQKRLTDLAMEAWEKGDHQAFTRFLSQRVSVPDGKTFTSTNVMDYDTSYKNQFTPQQVSRMRHTLYYSPMVPGKKAFDRNSLRSSPSHRTDSRPIVAVCRGHVHK